MAAHKTACQYLGIYEGFMHVEPYMPALAGQPSLHGNDACMVCWAEHYGETAGKNVVRPLFLLFGFFCRVGILGYPGPPPSPSQHFGLEVFNVGRWLTHGDLALACQGSE